MIFCCPFFLGSNRGYSRSLDTMCTNVLRPLQLSRGLKLGPLARSSNRYATLPPKEMQIK